MSASSAPNPIPFASGVRHAFGWSLAIAILIILAGFLSILLPLVSGIAIALMIGWFFILIGILHFLFAWKTHTTRGVLWEILLGIAYLGGGLFLFVHPIAGLASLTLFIGAYFLVQSVVQFIYFFQLRPRHGSSWLLFDAVMDLILALLIWRSWPLSSAWVVGTLIGIGLLFSGFSRLMLTLTARRILTAATA
jgi:uncharacterized membrane protein HdeD (DUF308 family)